MGAANTHPGPCSKEYAMVTGFDNSGKTSFENWFAQRDRLTPFWELYPINVYGDIPLQINGRSLKFLVFVVSCVEKIDDETMAYTGVEAFHRWMRAVGKNVQVLVLANKRDLIPSCQYSFDFSLKRDGNIVREVKNSLQFERLSLFQIGRIKVLPVCLHWLNNPDTEYIKEAKQKQEGSIERWFNDNRRV